MNRKKPKYKMTYFFIGLIAIGFIGYIGYFISTTMTTKANAANASGERTAISDKIDNLSTLLKVEDNLGNGIYRFTFKDENGKIISEDKSIDEFLLPYVSPINDKISQLEKELSSKISNNKTKIAEIEQLKNNISNLQSEKLELESRLESFLAYVSKVHIENASKIFKEATSYLLKGELDNAIKVLSDENISKDENNIIGAAKSQSELRLLKAKVLTIKGTIAEANQNFEKSIELNSNFRNTWEYGNFLQYQGEFDKSINYYNASLTNTSDETELGDIYNNLANSYSQQNDFYNSDKYFKKALEHRNTTINKSESHKASYAKTLSNYGRTLMQQGELNRAKVVIQKAEGIFKSFVDKGIEKYNYSYTALLINLGSLNSQSNKTKDAINNFEQALALTENFNSQSKKTPIDELIAIKLNLAQSYREDKQLDKAKNIIDEVILNTKKYGDERPEIYLHPLSKAYISGGNIYSDLENYEVAKKHYENGIKISKELYSKNPNSFLPSYFNGLNNYAAFLNQQKEYSKALELFNEIEKVLIANNNIGNIESSRRLAMINYNKGIVLNNLNKHQDALLEMYKVLKLLQPHLKSNNPNVISLYSDAKKFKK